MRAIRYGVCTTKLHGGGILLECRSLPRVVRWLAKHHDACFGGRGCEGIVASPDGGRTWWPLEVHVMLWFTVARRVGTYRVRRYLDPGRDVVVLEWPWEQACVEPVRPASEARSAKELALRG